tara:strand:- start:412 stop:645 length:234 start_codon:yes stop_codon:yes gene_type:complete
MNQAILFNDDFSFDDKENAWCLTAQLSGQAIKIYFHSTQLKQLVMIDSATKFDLEELTEQWIEKNEIEGNIIHLELS